MVGPGMNGIVMDANNNVVGGGGGGGGAGPEEGNRWTQFQVQQLWRHHAYLNGKDEMRCDSLVLGLITFFWVEMRKKCFSKRKRERRMKMLIIITPSNRTLTNFHFFGSGQQTLNLSLCLKIN